MSIVRILVLIVIGLTFSGAAQAHPALHDLGGADVGFAHPFTGLDHLLTMIAVGLWAGLLGGRAQWLVPAAFLAFMATGAMLGGSSIAVPGVETVVIASVVATGALIAVRVQVPPAAAMAIVGAFALFHGHAHGSEMPAMASPIAYGVGFVAATFALHGIGLFAAWGWRASLAMPRAAGGAIAVVGLALALPL